MHRVIRAMGGLAVALALSISASAQVVAPSYKGLDGSIQQAQGVVILNSGGTEGAASRGSLATGQVSAGTTATLIAAQRSGRQRIVLTLSSAVACSFGNTGVTTANGFPLQAVAGATLTLDTSAAVYAVCASTATIGYVEVF